MNSLNNTSKQGTYKPAQKIVITGHTSGIGKQLQYRLKTAGYEVLGLSRSNGFDLADTNKVVQAILDFDPDVVFNNAYHPFGQLTLLTHLHKLWTGRQKVIINTGSVSAYIPNYPNKQYKSAKVAQRDYIIRESFFYQHKNMCRLHNVSFGFVNTKMIAKNSPNFISPAEAARILSDLIPPQQYVIPEIMVNHLNANPAEVEGTLRGTHG